MSSRPNPAQKVTGCVERVACEVCEHRLPPAPLNLGLQPLCDDLVPIGETKVAPKYPTEISLCPQCLTAHHRFPVRKELLFPRTYHYRARFTQDVINGMRDLVTDCVARLGNLDGMLACDIGCNDGSLLSLFREKGATTAGIEPTDAAQDAIAAGHRVLQEYLTPASAAEFVAKFGRPRIIAFTNVFAHIESLEGAIAAVDVMMAPDTLIVIENHYLGSVLERNQFDTFYHEHPRTYSLRSFRFIAERLKARLIDVKFPGRYGGNIRVFISRRASGANDAAAVDESGFSQAFDSMQHRVDTWRTQTASAFAELRESGSVLCGKSFPGRASILINLLGLDASLQPTIFEKTGSMKIGCYVPGTKIEIHDDCVWMQSPPPQGLMIWAWHIGEEVARYLRSSGYRGRLYAPLPVFRELSNI